MAYTAKIYYEVTKWRDRSVEYWGCSPHAQLACQILYPVLALAAMVEFVISFLFGVGCAVANIYPMERKMKKESQFSFITMINSLYFTFLNLFVRQLSAYEKEPVYPPPLLGYDLSSRKH